MRVLSPASRSPPRLRLRVRFRLTLAFLFCLALAFLCLGLMLSRPLDPGHAEEEAVPGLPAPPVEERRKSEKTGVYAMMTRVGVRYLHLRMRRSWSTDVMVRRMVHG